ncbi:hypothetical protein EV651_115116 [Kribbella sp. VKM Ac-2571]|uniref:hypothetical protein n=1 Tax=Kribbella sp. VKM Ac-2571 TaxID=2512222 RepID=UPI00105B7BFE|nr:hypothetical protein [Kribbella sp. VKM Ac-2571]TDO55152.1 hypothetical protein EV651_115116 [Kribbella sp. VKM Ac-2571]
MTDVLTRPTAPSAGRDRRVRPLRRLGRSLLYDALLMPVGVQVMADAMLGEEETAARRWRRLGARGVQSMSSARTFGYGLLSAVLGLTSWFVMLLLVLAVVRGPFWGLVEHGPVQPGTWGGPTRAGAWVAHGLIAVPCIVVFLFALRGIAALQMRLVQGTNRWVLPATIVVAAGSLAFFWSWLQQL